MEIGKTKPSAEDGIASTGPTHSSVPLSTHFFNQRYLYAFATRAEVLQYIRTQAIDGEGRRLSEILSSWSELQPKVISLLSSEEGLPDTIEVQPVPEEHRRRLDEISKDSLFKKTFAAYPVSFALVEADMLVAPQRTVNLDYVDRLIHKLPKNLGMADLVEACLSTKRAMDPIQHLEVGPNTHVFSSPNSDIRFLGAFVKDLTPEDLDYAVMGGLPAAAIIAFVGYGGAPVNVFQVGSRLVLNNGFHRVFALRSLGMKKIPAVVQHIANVDLETPPVIGGLPKEYLLKAARPAMLKDFFVPDFAITIKAKDRIKLVTLGIATNQHDVPA